MNIAVYCASSIGIRESDCVFASELGRYIGERSHTLVFGGSGTGLMGLTARSTLDAGGRVIGVIPEIGWIKDRCMPGLSEYIYTPDMASRRLKMMQLADAYIALPGGTGTLDEISEIFCMKTIREINGKVILCSLNGYYEPLRLMLQTMVDSGYLTAEAMQSFHFVDSISRIAALLEQN